MAKRGFYNGIKPTTNSGIEWGHPLARGLVYCVPFNDVSFGGFSPRDIIPPQSSPAWTGTAQGYGTSSLGSGPKLGVSGSFWYAAWGQPTKLRFTNSSNFSFLCINTVEGGNATNRDMIRTDPGGPTRTLFLFRVTNGNVMQVQFGNTGGTLGSISGSSSISVTANKPRHFGFSRKAGSALTLYLDGKQEATGADASTGSWTLANNAAGSDWQTTFTAGAPNEPWIGQGVMYCVWNRIVTATEFQWLFQQPWVFFRRWPMLISVPAVVPGAFTPYVEVMPQLIAGG